MPVNESVVLPPDFLGGHAMEQQKQEKRQPSCLDQFKRPEDSISVEELKLENATLKQLVVRLSETVIRLVAGKK